MASVQVGESTAAGLFSISVSVPFLATRLLGDAAIVCGLHCVRLSDSSVTAGSLKMPQRRKKVSFT